MPISTLEHDALSAEEHRKQLYRAVIASTIGTTIEWYDFFLYSIVTGLAFAKLYFPNSEHRPSRRHERAIDARRGPGSRRYWRAIR